MDPRDRLPAAARLRLGWLLAASVAGCATPPYEPLRLSLEAPIGPAAFERALDALRVEYPSLAAEGSGMRARSAWDRCDDRGWPARRRIAVFVEDAGRTVSVVVELQHFRLDVFGDPEWTAVRGHARFERSAVALLRDVLDA